jgi:hypothetical protein
MTGIAAWIDVDCLLPGEQWGAAINAALADAIAMVYCISQPSLASPWMSIELERALSQGKRVIPLLLQPVPIDRLPAAIRGYQVCDVSTHDSASMPIIAAREIARALGHENRPLVDGDAPEARLLIVLGSGHFTGSASTTRYSSELHFNSLEDTDLSKLMNACRTASRAEVIVRTGCDERLSGLVFGILLTLYPEGMLRIHEAPEWLWQVLSRFDQD